MTGQHIAFIIIGLAALFAIYSYFSNRITPKDAGFTCPLEGDFGISLSERYTIFFRTSDGEKRLVRSPVNGTITTTYHKGKPMASILSDCGQYTVNLLHGDIFKWETPEHVIQGGVIGFTDDEGEFSICVLDRDGAIENDREDIKFLYEKKKP